ncbi:nuclear transport factor 2 family protein, partial [Streptomyces sp. SID8455]|nr:nuclear transport factor 2 family protein [Streptomyces sp. SID8455]
MGADPSRSNEPAELPTAISGYLVAHTARDTAAA